MSSYLAEPADLGIFYVGAGIVATSILCCIALATIALRYSPF